MSMVKDSEFPEAHLCFPVLPIRALQAAQCTGQGDLYSHTSTGGFCSGQSEAELLLETCGDITEPRKPGKALDTSLFLDLWWGCDLKAALLIVYFFWSFRK